MSTKKNPKKPTTNAPSPTKKGKKEKKPRPQGEWIVDSKRVAETSRPADYTFQQITKIDKMAPENARGNRLGLLMKGPSLRLLSRSLWLNNNSLTSLSNLHTLANGVLEFPDILGFLDVSCNEITGVHEDLFRFPNIKILYMHGNKITDPKEIIKLRKLKKLHHLTIYGNPMCMRPELGDTRKMVATYLPKLLKLDHNRFTELDRSSPLTSTALRILHEVVGEPPDWLFAKFPIPKLTKQEIEECQQNVRSGVNSQVDREVN